MAVNQDLYDTLASYFMNNPISIELDNYFNNSPTSFENALSNYFMNNPLDISQSLSDYFSANPVTVDLSTTNNKIDSVEATVNQIKTKVDTNLDAKVSSISAGSVDLTETNNKIDAVQTTVNQVKTSCNSVVSKVDTNLDIKVSDVQSAIASIAFDTQENKLYTLKEISTKLDDTLDLSDVSYSVDVSSLDLTPIKDSVVQTISSSVTQFMADHSLNGSSGALYPDGSIVFVDGDNRQYEVIGSQILTTIGGQADYFYRLRDSEGREMLTVQDNLSITNEEGV